MKALRSLALLLLFAGSSSAATVFVDAASGSGVEDGSAAAPFHTIQQAIQAAAAGDTVSVAPGIYYGNLQLRAGVAVASQKGPAVTVIDASGVRPAVRTDTSVTGGRSSLAGFTIRNAELLLECTPYPYAWAYVDDCVFEGAIGQFPTGIVTQYGCGLFLTRSVFRNIQKGVYAFLNAMNIYSRNVTFDSVGQAFYLYKSYLSLQNTTITNSAEAIGLFGFTGWATVWGDHNNVWNVPYLAGPNMANPPLYADISALAPPMSADPAFAGRAAGDFRLTPGSPLVDAGLDVGLPYFGAAPDIGARELTEIPLPAQVEALAESFATVTPDAFKNAAEQRASAFQHKLRAVLDELSLVDPALPVADQIALYTGVLHKLENDLLAKADGFYGGNPRNDWIVTKEAQDLIVPELQAVIAAVRARIAELSATLAP